MEETPKFIKEQFNTIESEKVLRIITYSQIPYIVQFLEVGLTTQEFLFPDPS